MWHTKDLPAHDIVWHTKDLPAHVLTLYKECVHLWCMHSEYIRDVAPSVFDDVAPSVFADVAPSVFDDVAPSVFADVAPSVFDDVAPSVFADVAPSVFDDVAPSVFDDVAPSVFDDVAPSVFDDVAPSVFAWKCVQYMYTHVHIIVICYFVTLYLHVFRSPLCITLCSSPSLPLSTPAPTPYLSSLPFLHRPPLPSISQRKQPTLGLKSPSQPT